MEDKRVTFETAKLAKEKGFNVVQRYGMEASLYNKKGEHTYYANYGFMYSGLSDGYISAPTQSLLQKWLREIHGIQVYVSSHTVKSTNMMQIYRDYVAYLNSNALNDARDEEYQTYEAALEFGLKEALKHVS
jgi:hypothetical protein